MLQSSGSRRLVAGLWIVALVLSGCASEPAPKPAGEADIGGGSTADGDPAAEHQPLTAAELAPVIREQGPAGARPDRIVVEFARPVVEQGEVDRVLTEGTELEVEPPVEGDLRFTSPSTLTFTPDEGFVPGTAYQVSLEAIATRSHRIEAPLPNPWTHRFVTPEFGFVRLVLARVDYQRRRVEVDLGFSAPVNLGQVRQRASFLVKDTSRLRVPLSKVRFERGRKPHLVRARLSSPELQPGRQIVLELAPGVQAAGFPELVADRAASQVALEGGKPAEIVAAYHHEGVGGFYVEVVCNDSAVEDRRYYWDRVQYRSYGRISARCQLEESAAREKIHIEPPVRFSTSPSSGGFRIFGDFARGGYALRIDAGARTIDGGVLYSEYETSFSIPARKPQVSFTTQGRYLPRKAWDSLPVRHLNVGQATLTVRHVPPENLVFWMSDDENEALGERTSNVVLRQKLALGGPPDALTTTQVDFASRVPKDTRGLIELQLTAGNAQDTARLVLTDLNLVAKRAGVEEQAPWGREVHVWALDSTSNRLLKGVEVKLLRKSGYVLATCYSDGEKGCRLEIPADATDPSPPFALVATRGADLTYLRFADLRAEVDEARVSGESYRGDQPYRAAVYSDRGVYRPGETAHLMALLRNRESLAPKAGMPVEVKLLDPRRKTWKQHTLATNAAGLVELDTSFEAFATTGRYELQVEVADRLIGRYPFQVEEFVPERMRVEAEPAEEDYLLGSEMVVEVRARYLFGGAPANHRVELACDLEDGSFEPQENGNFHYGVWRGDEAAASSLSLGSVTGALDEGGAGRLSCPGAGQGGGLGGPARLVARAAVFEAGSGRTTVGRATALVHPERFYLGLSTSAEAAEPGSEVRVQGVVVDWEGRRLTALEAVEIELLRLESEYGWYYDPAQGRETYRRYLRSVPVDSREVPVTDGRFETVWEPRQSAEAYLVRARAGGARTDLEIAGGGGWYYWGPRESEVDQTPRPDQPSWIALDAPEEVEVGKKVEVRFQAPFRGRALLTAETDGLLDSQWREVKEAGEVVWSFRVPEFEPNVYVTAFLVKDPHLDSKEAYLPDRAFGVCSLRVEPREFTHPLRLEVPAEVRSNSRLTVKLDLGAVEGPTYATVAAVDEGILSLTRFESPDPFQTIFARRALGVETFETVGWTLLVPPGSPSGATGGGEGGGLGRVQPVKPVALWSGLVEVSEEGTAEVSFLVPQYRGELRVMAVTSGPKRMGRADARVVVRDPLVLQTTVPRFLTLGDRFQMPVFVTNLSGAKRDVEVTVAVRDLPVGGWTVARDDVGPPVEILGDSRQTLTLGNGKGGVAVFAARARQPVGAASLAITARSGDLESREEVEVPLLPAGPKTREVRRIELAEGVLDLTPFLEGWLPLSERSTFWVTSNPYGDAFDHLKHLLRYPYGCLEQTTSTLRPLLYMTRFLDRVDPELARRKVEDMVMHGVDRLLAMQTPDGGFAYWPGGAEPAYWGTAYATHVLIEARQQEYPVPQGRIDEAVEWMEGQITHYFEAGRRERSWYTANSEPYLHLVLALAGKARKARVQRLIEERDAALGYEDREHLYMLKAALYLAGDHRYEADLRRPDVSPVTDYRMNGWSFYSDRRMRGFMLSTFVDLFDKAPEGERLANLVANALRGKTSSWYTTQELVWGITGLGKFVEAGAQEFQAPVLLAGGRQLAPQPNPPGNQSAERTWSLARASEYRDLTLEVPGKGEGQLYLVLSSEGVRDRPDFRVGGDGLALRRRFLDADGTPVDFSTGGHALGDLVYLELSVTNTTPERIANLALVDRIPAGWEIENPRLGRSGVVEWVDSDDLWEADHMDVRDDRIEIFGHLERGQTRKVVYAVRAVAAGRFTVPVATVEAMYDPTIWARSDSTIVDIAGPWQ